MAEDPKIPTEPKFNESNLAANIKLDYLKSLQPGGKIPPSHLVEKFSVGQHEAYQSSPMWKAAHPVKRHGPIVEVNGLVLSAKSQATLQQPVHAEASALAESKDKPAQVSPKQLRNTGGYTRGFDNVPEPVRADEYKALKDHRRTEVNRFNTSQQNQLAAAATDFEKEIKQERQDADDRYDRMQSGVPANKFRDWQNKQRGGEEAIVPATIIELDPEQYGSPDSRVKAVQLPKNTAGAELVRKGSGYEIICHDQIKPTHDKIVNQTHYNGKVIARIPITPEQMESMGNSINMFIPADNDVAKVQINTQALEKPPLVHVASRYEDLIELDIIGNPRTTTPLHRRDYSPATGTNNNEDNLSKAGETRDKVDQTGDEREAIRVEKVKLLQKTNDELEKKKIRDKLTHAKQHTQAQQPPAPGSPPPAPTAAVAPGSPAPAATASVSFTPVPSASAPVAAPVVTTPVAAIPTAAAPAAPPVPTPPAFAPVMAAIAPASTSPATAISPVPSVSMSSVSPVPVSAPASSAPAPAPAVVQPIPSANPVGTTNTATPQPGGSQSRKRQTQAHSAPSSDGLFAGLQKLFAVIASFFTGGSLADMAQTGGAPGASAPATSVPTAPAPPADVQPAVSTQFTPEQIAALQKMAQDTVKVLDKLVQGKFTLSSATTDFKPRVNTPGTGATQAEPKR